MTAPTPISEPLGRVGPYRLLRELGRGGMGVVYLGARADGQFEKQVAVKRIHPGRHGEELLPQFERERRILAHLDHPGIAGLIDEGVAEDGRPYLIVEYVEGLPIDRWCDGERLDLRERLELFRSVCAAIDSAHRSLVVHRDLKPSNLLVDRQGQPKLLDFGIAKELGTAPENQEGPEDQEGSAIRTRALGWTPSHASPEQVRGEPITTASDTYSAGVVLYQLVTGHLPLCLEGLSPAEAERTLLEEAPPAPSAAVLRPLARRTEEGRIEQRTAEELAGARRSTPAELARQLAGDLDTVLARALHKDPARRYATTAELAEDLRRFLVGLPVSARPDTFRYRAGKFIGRNRALMSATVLIFLSLVVGLSLSTWQYLRASTARDDLSAALARNRERSRELEVQAEELRISRGEAERQRGLAEERAAELERRTGELAAEKDRAKAKSALADENLDEVLELNLELTRQEEIARRRYANSRELTRALIFEVGQAIGPLDGADQARQIVARESMRHLEQLAAAEDADAAVLREVADGYLQLAGSKELPLRTRLNLARRAHESLLAAVERTPEENAAALDELGEQLLSCEERIAELEVLVEIEEGALEEDS